MPRSLLVALVVLASAAGAHAATPKAPVAKPAAQRHAAQQPQVLNFLCTHDKAAACVMTCLQNGRPLFDRHGVQTVSMRRMAEGRSAWLIEAWVTNLDRGGSVPATIILDDPSGCAMTNLQLQHG
ncbi:MAG: hypothetical protein U1E45_24050 [Geminicoccaceae bacterium]